MKICICTWQISVFFMLYLFVLELVAPNHALLRTKFCRIACRTDKQYSMLTFRFMNFHCVWISLSNLTLGFADALVCFDIKRSNYTSFISFFVFASRENRLDLCVRNVYVPASRYFFKSFLCSVFRLRCFWLLSRYHFTSDRSFSFRGLVQASFLFFRTSSFHVGYAYGICASGFRFDFAFCFTRYLAS